MSRETVLGAGGVQSDWAIWAGKEVAVAKATVQETEKEPKQPLADSDVNVEFPVLKARTESLERENELLRQRLAIADRQVEVKDSQINDFKVITENLTRQNQVLLMLAQGVPMERILKGGVQEIEAKPSRVSKARRRDGMNPGEARSDNVFWKNIVSRVRGFTSEGMTQAQIAEALNIDGVPTLSGSGKWNRSKVSNFLLKREDCDMARE